MDLRSLAESPFVHEAVPSQTRRGLMVAFWIARW